MSTKFTTTASDGNSKNPHKIENILSFRNLLISIMLQLIFLLVSAPFSFGQVNVSCNNNGTLGSGSDDYVTFDLNAAPPSIYFVAPYTYTLTATQSGSPVTILLSDGTPATDVPFGISSPFRTAGGTAGLGNILLTVTPNFGASTPVTYTLADPGACTLPTQCEPGAKTISYSYRSPVSTTDATDWATHIPQFSAISGRTLTQVDITMKSDFLNGYFYENNSATAITPWINISAGLDFKLGSSSIPLSTGSVSILNATFPLPARVLVPAAGAWGGDLSGSTLHAMGPIPNDFIRDRAFSFLDPTTDPRWVTNVTGNATDDDDIFVAANNHKTVSNAISYSAAPDLAQFIGTSGNIPLTYTTAIAFTGGGGGGNPYEVMRTQTYFEVQVTYTYTETCTALPVKLRSFSGQQAEESVSLNWEVGEEVKFSHYDVEQSVDAKTFRSVSTVLANGKDRYQALDLNPAPGKNYYRLKSVDLDGSYAYSRTISVDFEGADFIKFFPNPVSDILSIETGNIKNVSSVEILDAKGSVVRSYDNKDVQKGISVKSLLNGIYVVRINLTNGQTTEVV